MPKKIRSIDVLILSLFTILITFHPFYTQGEINLFELGLYLPGINAIFHGQIPFRDFFHLRGPFELYMPVFLMSLFGKNISVLNTYFYVGTILTLIICVLIAAQIYRTRFIFYLMVPVLIARTFPRVVFAIWGGMRFVFGLLALFFIIRFIQREKLIWAFCAGLASALGFFTSAEIGVCSSISFGMVIIFSFLLGVQEKRLIVKSAFIYLAGILMIAGPYYFYLASQHALIPYWDSVYSVVSNMQKVIDAHHVSIYPRNIKEAFLAMVNPHSKNFRHMTPSYLYLLLLVYLASRIKSKKLDRSDLLVVGLGTYGFLLYNTSFRGIWAAQFEMALQPEKILWFYVVELLFLFLLEKKKDFLKESIQHWKVYAINLFCLILIGSSLGYAISRYHHRFFAFRYLEDVLLGKNPDHLKPLAGRALRPLKIERAQGIVVPVEQAGEIETIVGFIQKETSPNEKVVMYLDQGIYNFLFDRPFLGRFPIPVFSWFNDRWHHEFVAELQNEKPRYVITPKKLLPGWKAVHFALLENRKKYWEVMDIIHSDYVLEKSTSFSYIYKRK